MSKQKGLCIALDGPDGVGKTTQVELLSKYFSDQKLKIHTTRHSGGTTIGEELSKVSHSKVAREPEVDVYISLGMAEALNADLQHRKQTGEVCIVDRSPLSMFAYNIVASDLKDKKLGYEAFERIYKRFPADIIFLLTADIEILRQRLKKRTDKPTDYFESLGEDFQQKVILGYKEALRYIGVHELEGPEVVIINAAGTVPEIATEIRQQLQKML